MVDRDYEKYFDMMTKDSKTFKNITPITTILEFVKYSPGKYAKNVKVPILYAICENDTVAPAKETLKYVKESEKGIIKKYHCGHFDIYSGEHFRKAIGDYIEFFKNNLHNQ